MAQTKPTLVRLSSIHPSSMATASRWGKRPFYDTKKPLAVASALQDDREDSKPRQKNRAISAASDAALERRLEYPETFLCASSDAENHLSKGGAHAVDPIFPVWKIPHGMLWFFKKEEVKEGVFSPILISVGTSLPLMYLLLLLWPSIVAQADSMPPISKFIF